MEDVHAISLHKSKVADKANNDNLIKVHKHYEKGITKVNVQLKVKHAVNITK